MSFPPSPTGSNGKSEPQWYFYLSVAVAIATIVGVVFGIVTYFWHSANNTTLRTAIPANPSTVTNTSVPTQPTATQISQPQYSANWSSGLNGWIADVPSNTSWNANNGTLLNDGSNCCLIIAPFHPNINNYAIDANIQISSCAATGGSVGLFGRGTLANTQNGGYAGYTAYLGTSNNLKVRLAKDHDSNDWISLAQASYPWDTSQHKYHIEFSYDLISFALDDSKAIFVHDNTYPAGNVIGIEDLGCKINISSFIVTVKP